MPSPRDTRGLCREKCGPILGPLLSGHEQPEPPIPVIFEDEDLIVVDKPPGLLSTPGRSLEARDFVETRLHLLRPEDSFLRAAHRLDEASSSILVLARSPDALRKLKAEFAERRHRLKAGTKSRPLSGNDAAADQVDGRVEQSRAGRDRVAVERCLDDGEMQ